MRFILALSLILPVPLKAAADGDADPLHTLDEVVVTGTKTKHRVDDTPIPTQIISKEEIRATGVANIEQVLEQVPDIYIRRNDEFRLGASTVRMQGADPNKVAILLNGHRFRGGVDGVVDLRDIPAQNIERIEIIRGPASSLYGSDAMAGVVNIITRAATAEPSVKVSAGAGNYGRYFTAASHGYRLENLSYFLAAQHDEVEIAQIYGAFSAQFAGDASDAKQTRDNVLLTMDYTPVREHRLSLLGDYSPVREGPKSNKQNLTTGLGWDWQLGPLTDLSLGVSRYGFDRNNDLTGFEEDLSYQDWSNEGRLSHTLVGGLWNESHLLSIGLRSRVESIDSEGFRADNGNGVVVDPGAVHENVTSLSPFLQDEISLGTSWLAVLGTSVDVHEYFGAEVSPRLSLSWRPSDRYRVSGSVGHGYRAPDLLQLFDVDANNIRVAGNRITGYVILGNRDLQPETDLGATLNFEATPLDGLTASLNFYRHDFRNLIVTPFFCLSAMSCPALGPMHPFEQLSGFLLRYENVSSALTQGFDIGVGLDPTVLAGWSTPHRLSINLNYGYLYSRNGSDTPGESGKELPYRPPHRFLPSLTYRNKDSGLLAKFQAEYEDRTYADVTNSPDAIAKSHWTLYTRLEGRPSRWHDTGSLPNWFRQSYDWLSVWVEVNNLTDTEFGIPTPMGRVAGRRVFLAGLTYER